MLNIVGLYIEVNRGDAVGLTFHLSGEDVPADGTEVVFKVAWRHCTDTPLIEKTTTVSDGKVNVSFAPEDTRQLAPGLYYWNACIQYENGAEPWTILRDWQQFQILPG